MIVDNTSTRYDPNKDIWTGAYKLTPNTPADKLPGTNVNPFVRPTADSTAAVKFDTGKSDYSLLPWDALDEVVKVMEYGKTKYSAHNWSCGAGFKYSRVFNATMRHLLAFMRGEDKDPETGLSHIAHCACNVLFLLHFIKFKKKYNTCDDRNVQ